MQPALSPDPSNTTNALLAILIYTLDNSTFSDPPAIPQWNGPPYTVVCSQTLGYVSLSFSLFAALGAVVGKQWLSRFNRLGEGTDEVRGRRRQQKLDGLKTWRFDIAMKALPALLHVALALFAIAISFNLWDKNQTVALAFICVTAFGGLVYAALTVSSLWFPSCPYETPFSAVARWMIVITIDIAQEFAYYLQMQGSKSRINPLIGLFPLLLLPVFGWGTIILTILVIVLLTAVWWLVQVESCRDSAIRGLESLSRRLSHFNDQLQRTPQQYPEFRSIAWILETSYRHDVIMAAVEQVPHAVVHNVEEQNRDAEEWQDCNVEMEERDSDAEDSQDRPGTVGQDRDGDGQASFDFFPLAKHLCTLFVGSVTALNLRFSASRRARVIALGKALVGILSRGFKFVDHPRFWNETSKEFKKFRMYSTEPEIVYLLQLVIALLPGGEDNDTQNITRLWQPKTIPWPSLFWSLPFLQSTLQNPRFTGLFSIVPPALKSVCFSVGHKWDASEQASYFRACQAYLAILSQRSDVNGPHQ